MFQVLSLHETLHAYGSVYYIGTVLPILLILLGNIIKPAKPARSKAKKEQWVGTDCILRFSMENTSCCLAYRVLLHIISPIFCNIYFDHLIVFWRAIHGHNFSTFSYFSIPLVYLIIVYVMLIFRNCIFQNFFWSSSLCGNVWFITCL